MISPENKAHGINKECCWHEMVKTISESERTQAKIHNIRMQITKS
jgi:hypothetical protein